VTSISVMVFRKITLVVGDESVRAARDGCGQVCRVGGPHSIRGGQRGGKFGRGAVERTQVETTQQRGQYSYFFSGALAWWLTENLGQQ
jgi:hypothetical protein